jgi:CheY-like chemotaxis protein
MDEETQRHIFEPFFTTKKTGTGLGLATARSIAEKHKGWLEVTSAPEQGSTFELYLPRVSQTAGLEKVPDDSLLKGDEHLLIVEDNERVLRTMAQSLRALGYTIHTATNATEAARILRDKSTRIDLLLSDVVLPGRITGIGIAMTARRLRSSIKIIITSGYISEQKRRKELENSNYLLLRKPFTLFSLTRAIREALHS